MTSESSFNFALMRSVKFKAWNIDRELVEKDVETMRNEQVSKDKVRKQKSSFSSLRLQKDWKGAETNPEFLHCVKNFQIRIFSSSVFSHIWIQILENTNPEKTPYLDTFHAVLKNVNWDYF